MEDRCHALEDEIEQYIIARDAYEQQLSSMAKSLSTMEEQLRETNQEKVLLLFDVSSIRVSIGPFVPKLNDKLLR